MNWLLHTGQQSQGLGQHKEKSAEQILLCGQFCFQFCTSVRNVTGEHEWHRGVFWEYLDQELGRADTQSSCCIFSCKNNNKKCFSHSIHCFLCLSGSFIFLDLFLGIYFCFLFSESWSRKLILLSGQVFCFSVRFWVFSILIGCLLMMCWIYPNFTFVYLNILLCQQPSTADKLSVNKEANEAI